MFKSGSTAALIKDPFPEHVGIVVSQDDPKSKKLSEVMDVSLLELEPDGADEPVLESENPERIVSLVEKDGKLPVDNISSRSNCKRSTAPGHPKRKPKKTSKPHSQDMIIEGTYYTNSEPELIKEGFLL